LLRRSRVGIIDFNDADDDEKISYCKNCLKYGFHVPLRNRIYPDNEPIPVDHSNFLQCHECGLIVPIYELERDSKIQDAVSVSDNPFNDGKSFLGIDSRKLSKKKRRQLDYDYINDEELKRELRKGSTLISYSEQLPQ
jgi:hypothetical protein